MKQHNNKGYRLVFMPEHHRANIQGYARRSIVVAEKKLKRRLLPGEIVHHINGKKDDDREYNVFVFKSSRLHTLYHQRMRAFRVCGQTHWLKCAYCKEYDDPENMRVRPNYDAAHRRCRSKYSKRVYKKQAAK